jgi:ATP-binding cassette subfamily B protein
MLAVVELADEIGKLPHLLDTSLGELGVNLSGGQRQRLTLARALLRPSSLLLFDDILSAVDTVTEERILTNIDRLCAGTSLLWVAHRPSTLRLCSTVIDLDEFRCPTSSSTPSGMV